MIQAQSHFTQKCFRVSRETVELRFIVSGVLFADTLMYSDCITATFKTARSVLKSRVPPCADLQPGDY
jgi:hypothetical protein